MKSVKQLLAAVLVAGSLVSSAWANDQPMYVPKTDNLLNATRAAGVTVQNVSYDAWNDLYPDYWVYATSYPSGTNSRMYLGPYGTTTDTILYPLYYPDNQVCFHVDTNTYFPTTIFEGCGSFGDTLVVHGTSYMNVDKASAKKAVAEFVKAKK
jgi:hypothetical protein